MKNYRFFCFLVKSLFCYAPKLEWVENIPLFHQKKFEIVKCNTGLQRCVGGCTHCMTVDGSFVAKSCAGDHDVTLNMLGVYTDGCKNITRERSNRYSEWLMDSVGKQMQLEPNFTQVCRCSWNACNGIPTADLMEMPQIVFRNHVKLTSSSTKRSMDKTTIIIMQAIIVYHFTKTNLGRK